jgi:hypothetical protein
VVTDAFIGVQEANRIGLESIASECYHQYSWEREHQNRIGGMNKAR